MKKRISLLISFLFFVSMVLCLFSLRLHSQALEKPLEYEVEVVLVEIPLFVTDKQGNPVKDLKPEDITIFEDGKKQTITHFILVENDSPQIQSMIRKYPSARRRFLLFFDFAFATPSRIMRARDASYRFVKDKLLPTDSVAIATYSTMGGLRIIMNFTNDRAQIFDMIGTLGLVKSQSRMFGPLGFTFSDAIQTNVDTMLDSDVSDTPLGAQEIMDQLEQSYSKTERIYNAVVSDFINEFEKLSLALNVIRGRKHIVFFSEGFDSKVLTGKSLNELSRDAQSYTDAAAFFSSGDTKDQYGDTGLRTRLYDVLQKVASADCPIHTVDIGGMRTQAGSLNRVSGGSQEVSSIRRGQDTLVTFASETGGISYKNMNKLDKPLENLLKVTNTYYIVGYSPAVKKKEGKYRKLKVKTTRPGIQISYRKGYYEPKPYKEFSSLEKRLQLVEFVINDMIRNEIQFDCSVSAFRGRDGINQVPVFLKFPREQFAGKTGVSKFEIYGYAISSEGYFRDFFHQVVNISPEKAGAKQGLKFYDLHLVPPGEYKIKLIVRDANTGEIGSNIQEITVPDYASGNLALSGPIFIQPQSDWLLSRGYDPENPTGRKAGENLPVNYPYVFDDSQFIPGVVPAFQRSMPAQFYLRVYNLKLHPQTNAPQVSMRFELINASGETTELKTVDLVKNPSQIEPGVFDLLFRADLKSFTAGPYQLKLTFKDGLANQEATSDVMFVLQ